MKAESYITSREVGLEYGYQLISDDGDFIMDMVVGDEYLEDTKKIEKELERHHPLVTMMAAAPALVAALEDLHDACEHWEDQNDPILVAARDAIAQAKGENHENI